MIGVLLIVVKLAIKSMSIRKIQPSGFTAPSGRRKLDHQERDT